MGLGVRENLILFFLSRALRSLNWACVLALSVKTASIFFKYLFQWFLFFPEIYPRLPASGLIAIL